MSDAPSLPWHCLPLTAVGLSTGALRALASAGYHTLGEVAAVPAAQLRGIKGLDVRSYRRLRQGLHEHQAAAAKQLRTGGMTLRQAAEVLGVTHDTVWRWTNEREAKKEDQSS